MDREAELRERARARLGMVLRGKYRLDAVIGRGGMAAVYAATHRNQKRFAVKVLHAELSMRADVRQRFLREGYAANTLQHPGAVAILDDDLADDGAAFLVMELLEGASLERLWELNGQRLDARVVLAVVEQVLETLAAAHARSIVHRDIKPANVFVLRDGTVKVLDFGIARVRDATGSTSTTDTGAMLGTPAFMAPEQAMGRSGDVDGQTDVWAVGATMFALLSGRFVHEAENATQMAVTAATVSARKLSSVVGDAAAPVAGVVDHALAFSKAERYPSAQAMREAVLAAHRAVYDTAPSRETLAVVVSDYEARATADEGDALAPTVAAGFTPDASGPGASGPRPAVVTPATPTPGMGSTGAPSVQSPRAASVALSVGGRSRLRTALGVAAVAGGLATLAMAGFGRRGSPEAPAPSATATAPASQGAAPVPPAVTASASVPSYRIAVTPPTASIEVDGAQARVVDGQVELRGAPGTIHLVHVAFGGQQTTAPVMLTETGPFPARVELQVGAASPPAPRGAPRPSARPSPVSAPPAASTDSVSRTLE